MATLASAVIQEIADHLQESPAFSTGLYSASEILGYIDDGQRDLLDAAPLKLNTGTVASQVNVTIYDEPANSLGLVRVAYAGRRLFRAERGELDREDIGWRSRTGTPRRFHVDHLPSGKFELDRKPQSVKTIHMIFVEAPAAAVSPAAALTVHDAFRHAVKWFALGKALSKQGEGQDVPRSKYCFERYYALVEKAKMLAG